MPLTESKRDQYSRPQRAPSLSITILPQSNGRYAVSLGDGYAPQEEKIGYGMVRDIEGDILPRIRASLEDIREDFGAGLGAPAEKGVRALGALYEAGRTILNTLLPNPRGVQLLWLAAQRARERGALRLELRSPMGWPIPLELLPLGPKSNAAISTKAELVRCAETLPAFSAAIRYIPFRDGCGPGDHLSTETCIPSTPLVPLLFLWHDGAPSAAESSESIKALGDPIFVDGPFPSSQRYNSTQELARLLLEQGACPADRQGGVPYRMVHVHAHGAIGGGSLTHAHTLHFAFRAEGIFSRFFKVPVPVSNGDLEREIDPAIPRTTTGPFIFINACGGAAPSYSGGLGLAGLFLKYGYRAVVGPRVSIAGPVAECIAQCFYSQLIGGFDLADSLLNARRELLSRWCNPLGAFYTIYGESGLHLDRRHDEEGEESC